MRTLLMFSNTGSLRVTYEVLGWSAAWDQALLEQGDLLVFFRTVYD